jgi:hypothetical protein
MEARLGQHPGEHVQAGVDLAPVALAVLPAERSGDDLLTHRHSIRERPTGDNSRTDRRPVIRQPPRVLVASPLDAVRRAALRLEFDSPRPRGRARRTAPAAGADWVGSEARGAARFQADPATGEARTSGTTASLAGLESAEDDAAAEPAIRRILLVYAVAFAHGGLPLIYMGDESTSREAASRAGPATTMCSRSPGSRPSRWGCAFRRATTSTASG